MVWPRECAKKAKRIQMTRKRGGQCPFGSRSPETGPDYAESFRLRQGFAGQDTGQVKCPEVGLRGRNQEVDWQQEFTERIEGNWSGCAKNWRQGEFRAPRIETGLSLFNLDWSGSDGHGSNSVGGSQKGDESGLSITASAQGLGGSDPANGRWQGPRAGWDGTRR